MFSVIIRDPKLINFFRRITDDFATTKQRNPKITIPKAAGFLTSPCDIFSPAEMPANNKSITRKILSNLLIFLDFKIIFFHIAKNPLGRMKGLSIFSIVTR
jgi:hypothetical protein